MERLQSRRFSLRSTKMLDEIIYQAISQCRTVEKLGGSGMRVVDKAEETSPGRLVALKLLPDSVAQGLRSLERLRRQARGIHKASGRR
jgi:hypothetical protein